MIITIQIVLEMKSTHLPTQILYLQEQQLSVETGHIVLVRVGVEHALIMAVSASGYKLEVNYNK